MAKITWENPTPGRLKKTMHVANTSHEAIFFVAAVPYADKNKFKANIKDAEGKWARDIAKFQERASYALATEAKNIVQEWLKRGGTYDVGWTGRAAKNIEVSHHSVKVTTEFGAGADAKAYEVYEKNPNLENRWIRKGLPEHSGPDVHRNITEFMGWVEYRQLKWLGQGKNPFPNRQAEVKAIANWVMDSIWEHGTNLSYVKKFGYRFFNYPQMLKDLDRPEFDKVFRDIRTGDTYKGNFKGDIRDIAIAALSTALGKERWFAGGSNRGDQIRRDRSKFS